MTSEGPFTCGVCGDRFSVASSILARYPGWTPPKCTKCRRGESAGAQASPKQKSFEAEYGNPQTGVFTDGFCEPNPGKGGWAAVKVVSDSIVAEQRGFEEQTTNNRMV